MLKMKNLLVEDDAIDTTENEASTAENDAFCWNWSLLTAFVLDYRYVSVENLAGGFTTATKIVGFHLRARYIHLILLTLYRPNEIKTK